MRSFLLGADIKRETLHPCYFFFGEEPFLAYEFIEQVKHLLESSADEEVYIDKMDLEQHSWMDVLDAVRTMPFMGAIRLILVDVVKGKRETLTDFQGQAIKDYLASPSNQTVLIVVYTDKVKKSNALVRFFSSFDPSKVMTKEIRPLKGRALSSWIDQKAESLGRTLSAEARARLLEYVGNDLGSLNNEIEKMVTYIGDKTRVELDDVNQISGWVKSFVEWEITDSLERGDYEQSLRVLHKLLRQESVKPAYLLGTIARFFNDILLAKLWLKGREKDKKEIFRELKPQIQEKFVKLYQDKFRDLFEFVDSLSLMDLLWILEELEKIDLAYKTSDQSLETLLEGFFFNYCRLKVKREVI